MRFKIDWANHIVGSKFTIFALFYFVFEVNFPSTSPRGGLYWEGRLTEGFLRYRLRGLYMEGLIFGILRYFYYFHSLINNRSEPMIMHEFLKFQ